MIAPAFVLALATVPARATRVTDAGASAVRASLDRERGAASLPRLRVDPKLSRIAAAHAQDMARRRYFSHVSPEGVDPFTRMRRAGYSFRFAGENIGIGANVARAQNVIATDTSHRDIILRPQYRRVGIGVARGPSGVIVVEDFSD
jgi:uncharacterized protein YkwD